MSMINVHVVIFQFKCRFPITHRLAGDMICLVIDEKLIRFIIWLIACYNTEIK